MNTTLYVGGLNVLEYNLKACKFDYTKSATVTIILLLIIMIIMCAKCLHKEPISRTEVKCDC